METAMEYSMESKESAMRQVKAMMSRQHSERWALVSHHYYADLALDEARAILAVSEPGTDITGASYFWRIQQARDGGFAKPMYSALATALAAFVGESK